MNPVHLRKPLVLLGMVGLLTGLWFGLVRMGWAIPLPRADLVLAHGPLMVCGFLGTVIGLERAVALGAWWGYAAPAAAGAAVIALLLGAPHTVAPILTLFASVLLLAMFARFIRMQWSMSTMVLALAAAAWCEGNLLWLAGRPIFDVVHWWTGFLVLTIVGERLLMSRIVKRTRTSTALFMAGTCAMVLGLVASRWNVDAGTRVSAVGMIVLSCWMLRYDIARKTVKQTGLTRYIAWCLLTGAVWLGVGGGLFAIFGHQAAGVRYDAAVHAVVLGFAFSMIFGHAPLIFPSVLNVKMAYRPAFYAHLVLLGAALALRVTGDLTGWLDGRRVGGLLGAVAIVLFVANTVASVVAARRLPDRAPR